MSNIRKILISSVISLGLLLISTAIINFSSNKNIVEIPVAMVDIKEGESLKNISYIEVKNKRVTKSIFKNIIAKEELTNKVATTEIKQGEIILNNKVIGKEDYLVKVEDKAIVSLPIKSSTEGISYRIKKKDKINVYYTAKNKLVDSILKSKVKVYSTNKDETMVTCLLYQNVEVLALTNNLGIEVVDGTATNIVVRLNNDEILELANLKEQGTFTYSLI